MDDLVRWLTACLDEDERIARRACGYASPEWHLDDDTGETVLWWPPEPHVAENERKHGLRVTADVWRGMTIDASGQQIAPHIAAHDPARVLREIEAKRRTLALHSAPTGHACSTTDETGYNFNYDEVSPADACTTLRLLATVYSDRPGYREEWAP